LNGDRGLTLVEVLIALSIMAVISAGLYTIVGPAHGAFRAHPAAVDMQQRLRLASEGLTARLLGAGAGPCNGVFGAPLGATVACVLPYRVGPRGDPPGTWRPDAVTVISVPGTAAAVPLAQTFAPSAGWTEIQQVPSCPVDDASCGLREGTTVLLVAPHGQADIFNVTAVAGSSVQLQPRDPTSGRSYPIGSQLVPVAIDTYYARLGAPAEGPQLVHGDGDQSDMPEVDHVARLTFEYFGDPRPPELRPSPAGAEPRTTYGPVPPPIDVDDADDSWPAGENCVFQVIGAAQVGRLVAAGGTPPLVRLLPDALTDGPWCPDGTAANRYDADLLRIRKVRVTIRVEASSASLRGADARLFTSPGTSRGGSGFVPDREVTFDVVPRALSVGR
jgi:prepilin-type N-terminal cleavage/methylation domain-containing protein